MYGYQGKRHHPDKQIQGWMDAQERHEAEIAKLETMINARQKELLAQSYQNDPLWIEHNRRMAELDRRAAEPVPPPAQPGPHPVLSHDREKLDARLAEIEQTRRRQR